MKISRKIRGYLARKAIKIEERYIDFFDPRYEDLVDYAFDAFYEDPLEAIRTIVRDKKQVISYKLFLLKRKYFSERIDIPKPPKI